ncbi:hypothetical protein B0H13DRAFT_2265767 [Mycena leptocephala]|nr:hypothetical protein B0H13DRAFT_2265767 [Mycena leptocephala]
MQITCPHYPGLINLPGTSPASAALVAELLHRDFVGHHCFFNDQHYTNHLSHHVLSLHDLGASPECIQTMFDQEAATQHPLLHGKVEAKADGITEANWTSHLGDSNANMYPDYLEFFSSAIAKHGIPRVLERYVFSQDANADGALMLARFVGGLVHPYIQAGFGIEFGQHFMVAQGSCYGARGSQRYGHVWGTRNQIRLASDSASSPPRSLRHFEPKAYALHCRWLPPRRLDPPRSAAIRAIYAKWTFNLRDDADFTAKIEQCMWQAALLLGATGKPGRKPRMDFALMHFLTSALRSTRLQAYVRLAAFFVIIRGRPRIDCALAMSYPAHPAPLKTLDASGFALGKLGGSSVWLPLLNNAGTPAGTVIGAVDADGKETHKGAAGLDGTLFIRVAGVLTSALGWVAHGDKEKSWDFSGIGWEEG